DKPFPMDALDACNAGIDALDAYFASHAAELAAATSPAEVEWASIASLSLRSWQGGKDYYTSHPVKSYEARDVAMAAILERSRALLFPDAKAVVWAHNYHLSEAHEMVLEPGLGSVLNMGTLLKNDLGEAYRAYALVGYDVEINWPGVG